MRRDGRTRTGESGTRLARPRRLTVAPLTVGSTTRAVPMSPRAVIATTIAAVLGLAAMAWPLLITPAAGMSTSTTAPLILAALLPFVIVVVLAELTSSGIEAKALAVLGVLAAVGSALRALGAGTAGIEMVFFLIVLGGRVFGPGFGFVLGSVTLFSSALLTGGVGPWLPYQMIGAGLVGLGAGLLPKVKGKLEIALLAAYSAFMGFAYGFLVDLAFWPFFIGAETGLSYVPGDGALENLHRFVLYAAATSLGWNLGRSVTTVLLVVVAGPALLAVLRRTARRASFS